MPNFILAKTTTTNVVLKVEAVQRHFRSHSARGATIKAVDGVSFEIERGRTFCLVGESGCGKSTLARVLVGLEVPTSGRLSFEGDLYSAEKLHRQPGLRGKIQMIFQDPYASLNPRFSVGAIIGEAVRLRNGGHGSDVYRQSARYLEQVGLSASDLERYPHEFSGGQRQRISIARALASDPELLICDEPTSALDVSVQAQILNLLKDLQQTRGLSYCFITHNLAVVYHMADTVGVMYLGKLVEIADKRSFFLRPKHPYSRMLLESVPKLNPGGPRRVSPPSELPNPLDVPKGCPFHPRCAIASDQCRQEAPILRWGAHGSAVACHAAEELRLEGA